MKCPFQNNQTFLRMALGLAIAFAQAAPFAHAQPLGYSPNWRSEDPAYWAKIPGTETHTSTAIYSGALGWWAGAVLALKLVRLPSLSHKIHGNNGVHFMLGTSLLGGAAGYFGGATLDRNSAISMINDSELASDRALSLDLRVLKQIKWKLEKQKRSISAGFDAQIARAPEASRAHLKLEQQQALTRLSRVVSYLSAGATPEAVRRRYPEFVTPELYRLIQDYCRAKSENSAKILAPEVTGASTKTFPNPTGASAHPRSPAAAAPAL